jgi:hypothetical protein
VSSADRPPQRGFRRNSRAENSRHAVRRTKAQASGSIHAAVSWTSQPSGKITDTHSIGSITDNDLGVFPVTKVAMKSTNALTPVNLIPRTPNAADLRFQRCQAPRMPLTFLAAHRLVIVVCRTSEPLTGKDPAYGIHRLRPRNRKNSSLFATFIRTLACLARLRGRLANTDGRGSVSSKDISSSIRAASRIGINGLSELGFAGMTMSNRQQSDYRAAGLLSPSPASNAT